MHEYIDSQMTLSEFLKALLERMDLAGIASLAVLPAGDRAAYTLLTDEQSINDADPFFPAMPVNAARAISRFTRESAPTKPVAFFLRPCELRALTELIKLNQASRQNLLLIGFDCGGVFPFSEIGYNDREKLDNYFTALESGKDCDGIRPVCRACDSFVPEDADIVISLIGRKKDATLFVAFPTEIGKTAASALGFDIPGSQGLPPRNKEPVSVVESLSKERGARKEAMEVFWSKELDAIDGLISIFDRCISCHACSYVCPICYCRNCYFDSQTFEYYPESYQSRINEKGALRLPADRLLFHLGRLCHVGLSCVACGMCEDACPAGIPVAQIFTTAGARARSIFGYFPGKDPNEPLPLLTYAKDELSDFED